MATKNLNIWQQHNKPIFVLAPMEDVTDTVFRQIVIHAGRPDLMMTEFTNVEGLCSKGRSRIDHRLRFEKIEVPLIAQIWGQNPDNFKTVATELAEAGFTGIDINMGCPERSIVRRGSCAGLINNPTLATEIIQATKEGAQGLPVSVKTRCGTSSWVTTTWAEHLLKQDLAALTIHGRIAKEMSEKPANWDEIAKVVEIRDSLHIETPIIGNGDVMSYQDGLDKARDYGVDGLMVGRGIFHNPWFFNTEVDPLTAGEGARLTLLLQHVELWQQTWSIPDSTKTVRNFDSLKKFYKMYTRELDNAADIRSHLMSFNNAADTISWLNNHLNNL